MTQIIRHCSGNEHHIEGRLHAPDFDLTTSMDCGQVFGWERADGAYWGVLGSSAVSLRQEGDAIRFLAGPDLNPLRIRQYLGLDTDLEAVLEAITVDDFMLKVTSSVRGLRLLRQDPWHCLCSYIISANNRVERIDRLVKEIARRFGQGQTLCGKRLHSLPSPSDLASCMESGVRACGVGFRAPYLLEAAKMVADGTIDFGAIEGMSYGVARDLLKTIPGVGDKIADCVLLFAFGKYEAFPVDVWIKRVMEQVYFDSCKMKPSRIRDFGRDYFGQYAGYAQEYIYHYARTYGFS
jgi:N-glycosylase/DNA lyase